MVSSSFCADSQNNIGSQVHQAWMTNVAVAAQQLYRANNLIPALQAFRGNNIIPQQLHETSFALVPSGGSPVSNAERNGQTNPAVVYNFSSPFSRQSHELVTTPSVSNNIIPSQTPVSWVNMARARPSTALRWSDLVTGSASNNVGSLFHSSSNPLPSTIQLVHDCGSLFDCPQGLGGHRSWHFKMRRNQEERVSIGGEFRGTKKFKSKSS
jgi:hypothetical protein